MLLITKLGENGHVLLPLMCGL